MIYARRTRGLNDGSVTTTSPSTRQGWSEAGLMLSGNGLTMHKQHENQTKLTAFHARLGFDIGMRG